MGFRLKKETKKIREKGEKKERKYLFFLLYFEGLMFFPPKEIDSKRETSFQN